MNEPSEQFSHPNERTSSLREQRKRLIDFPTRRCELEKNNDRLLALAQEVTETFVLKLDTLDHGTPNIGTQLAYLCATITSRGRIPFHVHAGRNEFIAALKELFEETHDVWLYVDFFPSVPAYASAALHVLLNKAIDAGAYSAVLEHKFDIEDRIRRVRASTSWLYCKVTVIDWLVCKRRWIPVRDLDYDNALNVVPPALYVRVTCRSNAGKAYNCRFLVGEAYSGEFHFAMVRIDGSAYCCLMTREEIEDDDFVTKLPVATVEEVAQDFDQYRREMAVTKKMND